MDKIEFDYDFKECKYTLLRAILETNEQNNKAIIENIDFIAMFITQDEEILKILEDEKENSNDMREVAKKVLQLNVNRLLTKKAFHRYIEKKHSNSEYKEYQKLYETYKKDIEIQKKNAFQSIEEEIKCRIEEIEYKRNPKVIKFDKLNAKSIVRNLLKTTLKETKELIKKLNAGKEENFDYSRLNLLDDIYIMWINSIEEKIGIDKITKAFINNIESIEIIKDENKDYYIQKLSFAISHIVNIDDNFKVNRNEYIVMEILRAVNNEDIARALCTVKYKELSIMDARTFKKVLQSDFLKYNYFDLLSLND